VTTVVAGQSVMEYVEMRKVFSGKGSKKAQQRIDKDEQRPSHKQSSPIKIMQAERQSPRCRRNRQALPAAGLSPNRSCPTTIRSRESRANPLI